MTMFEFAVTYVVCWWLVLFMVLPHQATPPAVPEPGHARSAPANPRLGRKIRWTTLIAILPAVAMYFIVDAAHSETIYHAGSGCKGISATASADLNTHDGEGTHGKKVAPATMNGDAAAALPDHYDMPLWLPSTKYTGANGNTNVDLTDSYIHAGTVSVGRDGSTTLDGKPLTPQDAAPDGCDQ